MLRGLPFLALTAAASTSNLDATEARRLNPIADPLKDGLRGIDTDLKIGAWESADPLAKYVKREFNMDCFSSDLYKLILENYKGSLSEVEGGEANVNDDYTTTIVIEARNPSRPSTHRLSPRWGDPVRHSCVTVADRRVHQKQ